MQKFSILVLIALTFLTSGTTFASVPDSLIDGTFAPSTELIEAARAKAQVEKKDETEETRNYYLVFGRVKLTLPNIPTTHVVNARR